VLRELESRLAGACWYFWYATSSFPEGRSVLSAAEQGDRFVPAAARAKVLEGLSAMESLTGDDGAAIGHAEEALEIRRRLGEPTGILRALVNAATASERGADPAGARARLEECRSLAEEVGDRWFFGIALVNLGSLALIRGDYLEAEQSLRASLAIWLELGDRLTGAAAETNLAAALLLQGQRDDALRRYRAVIDVWRELGATEGLVWCLEGLALAASDEDPQIAARIGGAVARACSDLGYTLPDQEEIWDERWRRVVQNRLGSDEIAACEAEGLQMTVDEAIDHALAAAARWNR
jgi:tetratricopeptide (TPR) repeat protein